MPKTNCKYSETKKVKQVHSAIPNLSSESIIRKLTNQNKTT